MDRAGWAAVAGRAGGPVVVFMSADYAALADARQRYGVIGGLPA